MTRISKKHAIKGKQRPRRSNARQRPADRSPKIVVELAGGLRRKSLNTKRLCAGVRAVLAGEGILQASISLAVVDDPAIHELNRRYLKHDEPTDVISFQLDQADGIVDGQIVVSADTAAAAAQCFGWKVTDELLLYVVHGTLHLIGYDDTTPKAKRAMRRLERRYLAEFGLTPRYQESRASKRKVSDA